MSVFDDLLGGSSNQTPAATTEETPTTTTDTPTTTTDTSDTTTDTSGSQGETQMTATQTLVNGLYNEVLARDADTSGLSYWSALFDAGSISEQGLRDALMGSTEYTTQVAPIKALYTNLLGRDADAGGLKYWVASGADVKTIAALFVDSNTSTGAEFTGLGLSDAEAIARLEAGLGVDLAATSLTAAISELTSNGNTDSGTETPTDSTSDTTTDDSILDDLTGNDSSNNGGGVVGGDVDPSDPSDPTDTPDDPVTYEVTASETAVDEGASVTFTLTTENLAAGTEVDYSISGVDEVDLGGDSLSGTLTIGADGTASVTVTLAEDAITEGEETLTFTVAEESAQVTVNDTSVEPNTGERTQVELAGNNAGTDSTPVTLDASEDSFNYTDTDVSVANNVIIQNFGDDDLITLVEGENYSFSADAEGVSIVLNNNGTLNSIELVGVGAGQLIYDANSLNTTLGYDAVTFAQVL